MKEIRFPSTLSMDYPNLLAESLAQVMEVPYGETLTVDLTETQKVSAFGVAALGARLAWLVAAKRMPSGSVIRRPENGRVSNDLMRMGLYRLIQEASVNVYTGEKLGERPQELWLCDRPAQLENAAQRLVDIVRAILFFSEADGGRLADIFKALGDNVFRHSKAHTGAMFCAQAFPRNGLIEFAVADTGQGIWASLKRIPALMESVQGDAHAILTAMTLKVRGADGEVRPGFLNTLVATARKTGGELCCMSGEAALTFRGGEMRNTKVAYFPGTIIGVRLRMIQPL